MTDIPTLGRAASLRLAYASAMQDVQQLRENYNSLLRDYLVATARADVAEAEVTRLRAFVAEHGIIAAHSGYQECLECGSFGYFPDNDSSRHESGCIVAEARRAQRET